MPMLFGSEVLKVEILFFAVVALVVLARLYQVLGQNRGAPPPFINNNQNNQADTFNLQKDNSLETKEINPSLIPPMGEDRPYVAPNFSQYGDLAPVILKIRESDNSFDPKVFLNNASAAYEAIITAYSKGDEAALKPLLSDTVFTAYQSAMAGRKEAGLGLIEIIRLLTPELQNISLNGKIAAIEVLFQSTLTESNAKPRAIKEIWTFERDLSSKNPIWKLIEVEAR